MRCQNHFDDVSSDDGVCATCLRERLLIIIEAQIQADLKAKLEKIDCRSSSEASTPDRELEFPRSDSPDVGCRKLDESSVQSHNGHVFADHRFYSTPQVVYKKKQHKNSIVSNLFRSKPNDLVSDPNSDLKDMESCSATSTSWISSMFPSKQKVKKKKKKKKKSCMFTLSDPNASRVMQRPCRGMSPAGEADGEFCDGNSTESSSQWMETPQWKETPQRTAAPAQFRCKRLNQARNVTGFSFCLSPVVRPSYNLNRKGMPPDIAIAGDVRIPVKPHIGIASMYCPNRSKKLADCGRFRQNY